MDYVQGEIADSEEKLYDRVTVVEEMVESLNDENNELRKYLNKVTEELNAIITLLNTRYENN